MAQPDIDGALVGGARIKIQAFDEIIINLPPDDKKKRKDYQINEKVGFGCNAKIGNKIKKGHCDDSID